MNLLAMLILQQCVAIAATVVTGVRALQKQWREIAEDIRTGTLNKFITKPEMRAAVEKTLKTQPEFRKHDRKRMRTGGLARHLPPSLLQRALCGMRALRNYAAVCSRFATFFRASPYCLPLLWGIRVWGHWP